MSADKHQPHVLVLPEDDANRQMARGFLLDQSVSIRRIQVLPVAGGWRKALDSFGAEHIREMDRYPNRSMVLLIDFDGHKERLTYAKTFVPDHLIDRVFVIGVWTEPEKIRADLGSYEEIGMALAKDCREETDTAWAHRTSSTQFRRDPPITRPRSAVPVRGLKRRAHHSNPSRPRER
jgi:hypothetical protein